MKCSLQEERSALAQAARARRLVREDRLIEALKVLDQAVQLTPESGVLHDERGLVLALLSREQEALQSYERALTLLKEPSAQAAVYFHRALLYGRRGELDQALLDVKRAARWDEHNATYQEALDALQQARKQQRVEVP